MRMNDIWCMRCMRCMWMREREGPRDRETESWPDLAAADVITRGKKDTFFLVETDLRGREKQQGTIRQRCVHRYDSMNVSFNVPSFLSSFISRSLSPQPSSLLSHPSLSLPPNREEHPPSSACNPIPQQQPPPTSCISHVCLQHRAHILFCILCHSYLLALDSFFMFTPYQLHAFWYTTFCILALVKISQD